MAPLWLKMPSQLPMPLPVVESKVTGSAAVPFTVSVPSTISSTREVFVPLAAASLVANRTSTPCWMVRKAPVGTVMSPWIV